MTRNIQNYQDDYDRLMDAGYLTEGASQQVDATPLVQALPVQAPIPQVTEVVAERMAMKERKVDPFKGDICFNF